jgi:hypothetical protein
MFRNTKRSYQLAFPSGEGGSRRLTDEETGVCTQQRTERQSLKKPRRTFEIYAQKISIKLLFGKPKSYLIFAHKVKHHVFQSSIGVGSDHNEPTPICY